MNQIQAAMEHCRLRADLHVASAYGDGWWIQEAVGALTRFVEERYEPQSSACGPTAHDSLPPPRSRHALDIVQTDSGSAKKAPSWMNVTRASSNGTDAIQ
jgi:hypothetical protein